MTEHVFYRIRWDRVNTGGDKLVRMCIAEKQVRFLFFKIWVPIARWRYIQDVAQKDIDFDVALWKPLPEPKIQAKRITE